NTCDRFRFDTLQSRFTRFSGLWDRGLRALEEGRPGPLTHKQSALQETKKKAVENQIRHVARFLDPMKELDKLTELYESVSDARRETGQEPIPFHKFAALIQNEVTKRRRKPGHAVAFRVAVKGAKVHLTAQALKGVRRRD